MIFQNKNAKSGFTLVELIVALSVYIIMAGLLLANQGKFNDSLSFSNLGYDIALTIRQTQTYGYAVHATEGGSANNFSVAYGVHFVANDPTSFTVFSEPIGYLPTEIAPQAYSYYQGIIPSPLTTISTYHLQNGYQISNLCEVGSNVEGYPCESSVENSISCDQVSLTADGSKYLDILFQRPNVNAFFFTENSDQINEAAIELTSPTGEKECISIFNSGDIEVSPTTASTPMPQ